MQLKEKGEREIGETVILVRVPYTLGNVVVISPLLIAWVMIEVLAAVDVVEGYINNNIYNVI